MNIHQVSISYVQEQDRMMIRINGREGGDELRAWLTRRLTLALLPALSHTAGEQMKKVAGPTAAVPGMQAQRDQLVAAFEKEASLRSGDFKTPYQEPVATPDQPGNEPLLLTEVKVTLMESGQLHMQLTEKLPGQNTMRNFQVNMDAQLSSGLMHLLHQSLKTSGWLEVPLAPVVPEVAVIADSEPAPLSSDLNKPKYLN